MEILIVLGIIVAIISAIGYAIYYLGYGVFFAVGKSVEGYANFLDKGGFAFLKDNLNENEKILINGSYRFSHLFPSFTYLCITIPLELLATWLLIRFNHDVIQEISRSLLFSGNSLLNNGIVFCIIFAVLFIFVSFWCCLFRFINRRKSEFVVTTERFAIRQFVFFEKPLVCRFNWEDFVSVELYQNVLDSILHNYSLRLSFETKKPKTNVISTECVDIHFLRNAEEIKKQINSLAKEFK